LDEPIERRIRLDAPIRRVWEAVTAPDHLEAWLGGEVELDARAGARITVRWPDGSTSRGLVERVEPPRRLVFRWRRISGAGLSLDIGRPSRVELVLEPADGGRTFVTVTEHDAPMPGAPAPVLMDRA
jgi:uncharacterized protein YndB with AHSA1/START domain